MKKQYVITDTPFTTTFMFESTDFRIKVDYNDKIIKGTFKRDKSVKGAFNGKEIGIFTTYNGEAFLIFNDFSAKKIK